MKVLIRVDASKKIGAGHVIRCRSLARSLQSIGCDVCFCGRISDLRFRQSLSSEFRILELSLDNLDLINPSIGVWLPVSELEDAFQTAAVLNDNHLWKPDWILLIIMGFLRLAKQMRLLYPSVKTSLMILQTASRPRSLIDQNTHYGDFSRLFSLLPKNREIHFVWALSSP